MLAFEVDRLRLQALHQHRIAFLVERGGRFGGDAEIGELVRRAAAPDAELEPAARHLVEHADFFQEAQRIDQRQRVDQRADAQPFGALRDRGEKHAGRTGCAERRRMVLGDQVGVKTFAVVHLGQPQPVLVMLRERQVAAIDVIEDTELQDRLLRLLFCA